MNFFEETSSFMIQENLHYEDVVFIGSADGEYSCTTEEFLKMAHFECNNGFGTQFIAKDLIIVFKNEVIMSRREYDGSEWWEIKRPFKLPEISKSIKRFHSYYGSWSETLKEINKNEYDK